MAGSTPVGGEYKGTPMANHAAGGSGWSPRLIVGLGLLTVGVVLAVAVLVGGGLTTGGRSLNSKEIRPPKPAPDFRLVAAAGEPVELRALRGKVVVLYFGYTLCPDVCPMTLGKLAQARARIGDAASDLRVVMITVDPERDTPDLLGRYAKVFDPSFLGLGGSPEEIQAVANAYGIYYQKRSGSAATGYLVDHTATALAIDREGQMRFVISPTMEVSEIADDLRTLLRGAR